MKNVDSLLKAELEKLGVPVERLKYGGKAATTSFTPTERRAR